MSIPAGTAVALATLIALPVFADVDRTPAHRFVAEFLDFCNAAARDPKAITLPDDAGNRYFTENADGSVVYISMTHPYENGLTIDATRNIGATVYRLSGGRALECSASLTDWDKPDEMLPGLPDAIGAATPALFGTAPEPQGGQLKDMILASQNLLWSDDSFPPATLLQASIGQGQISLTLRMHVSGAS